MKTKIIILLMLLGLTLQAQENRYTEKDLSINQYVDGTLLIPNTATKPSLAILIAGSGPTNRNGNQNFLKNNSLKKLAEGLSKQGIATFRYDKRIVKQIRNGTIDKNIKFDDFVTDAKSVIDYFKASKDFKHLYLIGHSQGSLVGMLAAPEGADGLISLAGAGQPIDKVIVGQIGKMAPALVEDSQRVFDTLRTGKTTPNFPPALSSVFNLELQPFMMNWMQYNPQSVVHNLKIPVLIINGTKDLQVSVEEAELLQKANPKAQLVLVEKMNHILVPIDGDDLENTKSYNEPQRALSKELVPVIADFIKQNDTN